MFALYYPEEGRYSENMSLREARILQRTFFWASIVNTMTGEIYD